MAYNEERDFHYNKKKKDTTLTLYEHNCRCHCPHDPYNCEACLRARLMAKKDTRNQEWTDIEDKDKGYVYSVDFVGPYSPDVDGNIYGFVGIEIAHINYGIVTTPLNT